MKKTEASMIKCNIIRSLDIIISGLAILILSPFLILVMVILSFTGEGEIFYRQVRVGKNFKEFYVLKFATMLKDSPNIGSGTITLRNDPRVLPFGQALRKTKLNEIPQLINVLKGDMSLIGPRPQTDRCFKAFDVKTQNLISTIRPGLSGIGSIIFRNEDLMLDDSQDSVVFYDEIIAPYKGTLEQWYVENNGLTLYWQLIFLTIVSVISSNSRLIWQIFPNLPKPPNELLNYFVNE